MNILIFLEHFSSLSNVIYEKNSLIPQSWFYHKLKPVRLYQMNTFLLIVKEFYKIPMGKSI